MLSVYWEYLDVCFVSLVEFRMDSAFWGVSSMGRGQIQKPKLELQLRIREWINYEDE